MKLSNREILEAKAAIDGLLQMKLPVKTSWGLAKMGGKLYAIAVCIDAVKQGLFTTYQIYVEKGEKDNVTVVKSRADAADDSVTKFMGELNTLLALEVEVDLDGKVALPLEVDDKPLEIEGSLLMPLEKLITVE